jgi:hypothetical protein
MVRIESPDFAESIINEYQNQRVRVGRNGNLGASGKQLEIGDKCEMEGCGGTIELKPAGVSMRDGLKKPYSAFLGCNNYRSKQCKNSAPYVPSGGKK